MHYRYPHVADENITNIAVYNHKGLDYICLVDAVLTSSVLFRVVFHINIVLSLPLV